MQPSEEEVAQIGMPGVLEIMGEELRGSGRDRKDGDGDEEGALKLGAEGGRVRESWTPAIEKGGS